MYPRRNRKGGFIKKIDKRFKDADSTLRPDYILIVSVFVITIIGLLMLSSVTSVIAFNQTGDSYAFVKQQFTHGFLPGLLFFLIVIQIPYFYFKKWSMIFLGMTVVLLLLVFVPHLGITLNNVRSWIQIGSITIQTSEIAKLTLILGLAGWLSTKTKSIKSFKKTTLPFVIIIAFLSILILKQPDLGTLIVFIAAAGTMFIIANANLRHLLILSAIGMVGIAQVILTSPYKLDRIMAFLHPESDILGSGYQVYQSLLAIGSGSWFGLGIGQSRQKFSYVPEITSDSIFAIIGEEIGFVFSAAIIVLFAVVLIRGVIIAKRAPDTFGSLVAIGITFMIAYQVLINIGAMLGLLPLTGLPLPFISLGGTNLAVLLTSIGILANISKYSSMSHA